jgi:type II secretory pathway pseudopilin PulG
VGIQNSEFRIQNSSEAGYTLAIFVMVIAIMAIMMAAAVEIVSFQAQREREAELIFRGQQYVEGIRLYKIKYGRFPMRMKELWEADPKVLRRKWADPITGSDEWGVVFQGQEGQSLTAPAGGGPRPTPTRTPVFERNREGGGEKVGPIVGVHSLSTETSIKVYEGRTQYDMWKFIFTEQPRGTAGEEPWGMPPTPIGGFPGRTPGRRTPGPARTGTPNY